MKSTTKTITLISGGNAGIGYEIVKKLATENPSYHILMGCRDTKKGDQAFASLGSPPNVAPIQLDITSDESIAECSKTISEQFGRLDLLINNAGTAGRDLPPGKSLREIYTHCYSVNVISAAVLTDAMIPLLSKSHLPKIIFISSALGSISHVLDPAARFVDAPYYSSTKSAMNALSAHYSKKYADKGWKVNACCPGYVATALNNAVLSEATDPKNGAINAVRLATAGPDGETGTFSNKEGPIQW